MSPNCEHCGALLVPYKDKGDNILFCPVCGAVKSRNNGEEMKNGQNTE
jgi:DNA-directed RNA polymerase subunit M/transcription elongation factor TFIIS